MTNKKKNIILGIDPGFADTGYGIVEFIGGKTKTLGYGSIKTPAKQDFSERLEYIYNELNKLIKKYKPGSIAVEQLFFYKNVTTAIKVSQARGIVLLAAQQNKLSIHEYTPLQIKQSLTGYGRAEKKQMQLMIKAVLGLKEIPKPDDAADALAVALCCFASQKLEKLGK
ncbi:MAG: crossover junction endodeoxyribonuclease RuvC [Candidatus Komeilibacteria bacterium]